MSVGDIISTAGDTTMSVGGYHQYRGMFSTLGDTMMSVGGYHEYTGECQYSGVSIQICFPNDLPPHL